MFLKFQKPYDKSTDTQFNVFGLKLLKEKYIDEWIAFKGAANSFANITFEEDTMKINYSSYLESGEIFEKLNEEYFCNSEFLIKFNTIKLNFENQIKKKLTHSEYVNELNGTFHSSCRGGLKIKFELKFNEETETNKKITIYSTTLTILVILQILNNIHMVRKVGSSLTLSNSVKYKIK